MIKVQERWQASCNNCFKDFMDMDRKYVASYKVSIIADLKTQGWKVKNNNCWCPECKKEVK